MGALIVRLGGFLLARFAGLAQVVIGLAVAAFTGFWLLGTDLAAWVFEQVLNVVIKILDTFSFNLDFLNVTQYIPALPPEVVNLLGALGLGQAIGVIFTAITIRVILQLVPFTRLGS